MKKWLSCVAFSALGFGMTFTETQAQSCPEGVCIGVMGRLASVDSTRGALIDALVGGLLDSQVHLEAVEWTDLANSEVKLLRFLDALAGRLEVGTAAQALDADATLLDIVSAAADVAEADGDTATAAILRVLTLQVQELTQPIQLGDLLRIELPDGALAHTELNVLDLVTATASLFNYRNLLTTPRPITISGASIGRSDIVDILLYAQVVEPPLYVCGGVGTQFYGAALRVKMDIDLVDVNVDLGVIGETSVSAKIGDLELFVAVTRLQGTLTAIDALADTVTLQATPGLADLYLGHISDTVFFNRTHVIDPAVDLGYSDTADLTTTIRGVPTTVDAEVRAFALGQAPNSELVTFTGPYPQTKTVDSSANAVNTLLGTLIKSLEIRLVPSLGASLDGQVLPVLRTTYRTTLSPILSAILTQTVDPLLETLGIRIGEGDITVLGLRRDCADLSVSIVDDPDPVQVGGTLVYTVQVGNGGPFGASNVQLTETLPACVTLVSAVPAQGTCSAAGANLGCSLGSLANGASTSLQITVTVNASCGNTINTTANVISDTFDPNLSNNTDSEATTVLTGGPTPTPGPEADLSVVISDSPDPVLVGGILTYDLSVANAGPVNATNVILTQHIPPCTSIISFTPAQGTCTVKGSTMTCNLGTIDVGASTSVQVVVRTSADCGSVIITTAETFGDQTDPDLSNNSDSEATTLQAPATPTATLPGGGAGGTATRTPTPNGGNPTATPTPTPNGGGNPTATPTPTPNGGGNPTATRTPTPQLELCSRTDGCFTWTLMRADFGSVRDQASFTWKIANRCADPMREAHFAMVPAAEGKFPANHSTYRSPAGRQYKILITGAPKPQIQFVAQDDEPIGQGEEDLITMRFSSAEFLSNSVFWNGATTQAGLLSRVDMRMGSCIAAAADLAVLGREACFREINRNQDWTMNIGWKPGEHALTQLFNLYRLEAPGGRAVRCNTSPLRPDATGAVRHVDEVPAGSVSGYRIELVDAAGKPMSYNFEVRASACATKVDSLGQPVRLVLGLALLLGSVGMLRRRPRAGSGTE